MYVKKIPDTLECGIEVAMKVLGGKWKPCILDAINREYRRPSEMHRFITSASPRVINMQLRELEEYGMVYKKVYDELPLKVEYYLTDLGQSILPIIDAMDAWGTERRELITRIDEELQGVA